MSFKEQMTHWEKRISDFIKWLDEEAPDWVCVTVVFICAAAATAAYLFADAMLKQREGDQ